MTSAQNHSLLGSPKMYTLMGSNRRATLFYWKGCRRSPENPLKTLNLNDCKQSIHFYNSCLPNLNPAKVKFRRLPVVDFVREPGVPFEYWLIVMRRPALDLRLVIDHHVQACNLAVDRSERSVVGLL